MLVAHGGDEDLSRAETVRGVGSGDVQRSHLLRLHSLPVTVHSQPTVCRVTVQQPTVSQSQCDVWGVETSRAAISSGGSTVCGSQDRSQVMCHRSQVIRQVTDCHKAGQVIGCYTASQSRHETSPFSPLSTLPSRSHHLPLPSLPLLPSPTVCSLGCLGRLTSLPPSPSPFVTHCVQSGLSGPPQSPTVCSLGCLGRLTSLPLPLPLPPSRTAWSLGCLGLLTSAM